MPKKPLKARRGLTSKPKVLAYKDFKGSGLIRVLFRGEKEGRFPEFALYPRKFNTDKHVLLDAGLREESKGKWVLRTNKFNIFVYV